jgi:hypothetical protein
LSELEEEVSSEVEETNLSANSDEKLLIQRIRSEDGDISDSENNNSIRNDGDTSDHGSNRDASDNEEDQFFDEAFD